MDVNRVDENIPLVTLFYSCEYYPTTLVYQNRVIPDSTLDISKQLENCIAHSITIVRQFPNINFYRVNVKYYSESTKALIFIPYLFGLFGTYGVKAQRPRTVYNFSLFINCIVMYAFLQLVKEVTHFSRGNPPITFFRSTHV